MKIINIILTALFALFAFFQWNDPDPWLWVSIYGLVAGISAAAIFQKRSKILIYVGIAICLLGLGLLFPELINWVKMGLPNIAESMKTEKLYIEFVREFFGLVIVLLALVFHWWQGKRADKKSLV